MSDQVPVLAASHVSRIYQEGPLKVSVLADVNLHVAAGERIAIVGASGSGKSTLLHLLGGLDAPSSGEIRVQGQLLSNLGEAARGALRNRALGFVYQFHHLLPEFTALENVMMPLLIRRLPGKEVSARAAAMLDKVGLATRLQHKPGELSGGERQRAALARALVTEPACVLADEPTGNLDHATARRVFELMLELNASLNTSLVIVTHDREMARQTGRVLTLEDGQLLDTKETA
jgi:lipoprotein-releasing system ATP-binding protein